MYHNAPPIASLGSSQQMNGTSNNSNWDQSQRMRGKVRYGGRNASSRNGNNSSGNYENNTLGGQNGLLALQTTGNKSPRGSNSSNRRTNRRSQNRNSNNTGSGNVGAGGSVYFDGPTQDNVNATNGVSRNTPSSGGYNNQQILPRIGSSNNNAAMGRNRYQSNSNNNSNNNSSNNMNATNTSMHLTAILQNSQSNSNNNMNGNNSSGKHNNMPNLFNNNGGNNSNNSSNRLSPMGGGNSPTNAPRLSKSNSNNSMNTSGNNLSGLNNNSNHNSNMKLVSGVSTLKGYKPSNPLNWINQDNYFILENVPHNTGGPGGTTTHNSIYCVLDGHGEHGHIVSKRISEILPQILTSKGCILPGSGMNASATSSSGGNNNNIKYYYDYKKAFLATQNDMNSNTHTIVDASCSGATCVLINVNLDDGIVIIANAGDSRAICGSSKRNPNGNVTYIATPLSYDHKPDRQDERKRILGCNGRVGCRQMTVPNTNRVSVPNNGGGSSIPSMISVPVGPCRVWYSYRGDTLGLAMSRSLGDCVVHQSGVSAEPEIVVYRLNNINSPDNKNNLQDEFIVLATDGIWDVLDNNTVVQLVVQNFITPALLRAQQQQQTQPNWSSTEAANFLTKTARAKWEKLSPMIDDITCIVVKLQ